VRRHHTSPLAADSDGDGASDGDEVAHGSDPLDPTSLPPPPVAVPVLPATGVGLLAALLALSGARRLRTR